MDIKTENIIIDHSLLNEISSIDNFNTEWPYIKKNIELHLGQLKTVSTIASIGSSTRIEGSQMSDDDINNFLNNIEDESFLSRDQQEVLGYKNCIDQIFDTFPDIHISENMIKQLHKILLSNSTKDSHHLGNYKNVDNNIIAQKNGKQIGIIFKTSSPFETSLDMEKLISWYNNSLEVHPLIRCAVFIVHFLAIHPFQDGNGRLSRALTTLILLREGYSYAPYCSLESIIEKNKASYYKMLRKTQVTLRAEPNYNAWFKFFFSMLAKQQRLLSKEKDNLTLNLTGIQEQILEFALNNRTFQNATIVKKLNLNRNTVKINLLKLVKLNLLAREGVGKGSYYRLKNAKIKGAYEKKLY